MSPFVGIAISMLPQLAGRVADGVLPDAEERMAAAVRETLGTDDPARAQELLADPQVAADLRVALARIEVEAATHQAERERQARDAGLDKIAAELRKLRAELRELRERMEGARPAQDAMVKFLAQGGVPSRGPAAVPAPVLPAKPSQQFHDCMAIILAHEGGYVDHKKDPGGATNLGITHLTLAAHRGVPKVTPAEVKALTVDEAKEIYRLEYWNKLNCDGLPAGVDLVTFDFGVNAGVSRSARMLQDIVAAKVDGQIGARTLEAVRSYSDPRRLIETFSDRRLVYYRSLKSLWRTFGKGWTRRTEETRAKALAMLAG